MYIEDKQSGAMYKHRSVVGKFVEIYRDISTKCILKQQDYGISPNISAKPTTLTRQAHSPAT
jgi:hypothetical protein